MKKNFRDYLEDIVPNGEAKTFGMMEEDENLEDLFDDDEEDVDEDEEISEAKKKCKKKKKKVDDEEEVMNEEASSTNYYQMIGKLMKVYNDVGPKEFFNVLAALGLMVMAKKKHGDQPSEANMIQLNKKTRKFLQQIYSMELEGGNLEDPNWASTVLGQTFADVQFAKPGKKAVTRGEKGAGKEIQSDIKKGQSDVKEHKASKKVMRDAGMK